MFWIGSVNIVKMRLIQSNPYQANNSVFHRTITTNFTISMEIAKASINQRICEKEEWT